MVLWPYQRKFLRACLNPKNTILCLSFARGNGKTPTASQIAWLAFHGFFGDFAASVDIFGPSHLQAKQAFNHILRWGGKKFEDRKLYKFTYGQQYLLKDKTSGISLRSRGASGKTAHGLVSQMVILDEPAQLQPNTRDELWASIQTSLGKVPDSKAILIGTQSKDPNHFFSKLCNGQADYVLKFSADDDDDVHSPKTWAKANPSLKYLPTLRKQIAKESEALKIDPSCLGMFRNLRLNLPVDPVGRTILINLLDYQTHLLVKDEDLPGRRGPYCLGIDLGGSIAQSAVAAFWPATGRLEAHAFIGSVPDLKERGKIDNVGNAYCEMRDRGELSNLGERTVPFVEVMDWVKNEWGNPALVSGDRYKKAELLDAIDKSTLNPRNIIFSGQGFRDGTATIQGFRRAVFEGKVKVKKNLLLEAGLMDTVLVTDPMLNLKIAKGSEGGKRLRAKTDIIAATVLAVSVGRREYDRLQTKKSTWGSM